MTKDIIGYIKTSNSNDNYYNLVVVDDNNLEVNIKSNKEQFDSLLRNHVYKFNVKVLENKRTQYYLVSFIDVSKINSEERDTILRKFMNHSDYTYVELKTKIYYYLDNISNKILKDITKTLIEQNLVDFLTCIGGMKIHHAYLGGLATHAIGMLELADNFLKLYPFLEKDYLYAGILLHDLGKIREYSEVQNPEFTLDGHLLGHLIMGAMDVEVVADKLGYINTEEVKILEHLLISHHGQLEFGAAKKPKTAEAVLLWYIDTLDSKLSVLSSELARTEEQSFTDPLLMLERQRVYKPKKL